MSLASSKMLLVVTLAGVLMTAAFGQKKSPAPRKGGEEKGAAAPRPNSPAHKGADAPKDAAHKDAAHPAPNPLTAIDRWNAMNPKQRERMLERMDPDRRKQFVEKLNKFNSLPREEQQLRREQYERLSKLPPDQQQFVRRDMNRFEKLPPARQQAVQQEFQKLRKMSESERTAYFDTPDFKDKFYPAEQEMIQNLSKVMPTRK
jgi:hypothetical protein